MDAQKTADFLARQTEQFGGHLEIEPGVWALMIVAADDSAERAAAEQFLADAPFPCTTGESEDDRWIIHCVRGESRTMAAFWMDDLHRRHSGRVRNPSPERRALIDEVVASPMPHRTAKLLADLHSKGELVAGTIREPHAVRGLLDRLHAMEPLYFSAFQSLIEHHLIDLVVLARKLLDEDIRLENELTRGSLSRDPFFQARQSSAARIRDHLVRWHLINPIDQQKSAASANPYASFADLRFSGGDALLPIDGMDKAVKSADFVHAVRLIRRDLYRGGRLEKVDTQTPWITGATAYPFRFIKQRIDSNRELSAFDWLYMLERAVDPDGNP